VRGLPEFGGEWPAAVLAEEMETPGSGQIRAFVSLAGNPVLSTPNGARLERALAGLDFMVSIDPYLNETSRHAHLVLPPVSPLERDHYDLVFHVSSWTTRAAGRLGPRGLLALLLRTGPHGRGLRPWGRGLTLKALEAAPHGVDIGPLTSAFPEALRTADRHIALAPPILVADLQRARNRLAKAESEGGLSLIGRRQLRSNNSWMHNSERLTKGPDPCTLLMHPGDASARGLAQGDRVEVRSRAGQVQATLSVTDAMRPGVVSLPHGWGHHRPGIRLGVAAQRPGVSLNDVTDEAEVDVLCGTAVLNGVPVEVTRVPPPPAP
jgi:anaerobic selenocysteine-containing dehydrogenase